MKDQSIWLHLNIAGRIFGIWCGLLSLIFIGWGIGANIFVGIESTPEIKLKQQIYLGIGIFLLIASIGLCLAKPYRPDIEPNTDSKSNLRGKLSWWTGDPV